MAKHIGRQVSLFRAWVPVAGVLLLIGFVPGMPNFLFLFAAAVGLTAFLLRNFTPEDDESVRALDLLKMEAGQVSKGKMATKPPPRSD